MFKQLLFFVLCIAPSSYGMKNDPINKLTNRIRDIEFSLVLDMRDLPHEKMANNCYIALANVVSDMHKVEAFPTKTSDDTLVKKQIYAMLENHKAWICQLGLMHCRLHQEKTDQVITLEEAFKNKY